MAKITTPTEEDIQQIAADWADRIIELISRFDEDGPEVLINHAIDEVAAAIRSSFDDSIAPEDKYLHRRAAYSVGVQVGLRLRGPVR